MNNNKDKLNLVLDYNNLAMRALFTCQFTETNVDISNFDTVEECDVLVRKLASDIAFIIRTFVPDRVILACDAKYPWRNNLYTANMDGKYKGTRDRDEKKNWTNIFNAFDTLKLILKERDFVVTELDRTEADDIAAFWKEELMDKNKESLILVSSDKDWTQLVSFDGESQSFCACFNPIVNPKKQKKLYVTEEMKIWLDTPDKVDILFTNYNVMKKKINSLIQNDSKIYIESIDADRVLLDKIMCGDDGDNVPAFYDYYKNGKKNRVTPLKASHVFESLGIYTVDDLIKANEQHMLKDALEKEMKRDVDVDFDDRLERQRKLVELKTKLFPDNIVQLFEKHKEDVKSIGYGMPVSTIRMDDILRGTRYITENFHKKAKENSIFNDFKSLSAFSNPNKLF